MTYLRWRYNTDPASSASTTARTSTTAQSIVAAEFPSFVDRRDRSGFDALVETRIQ
jgi:hypothetical protein